MIILLLSMSSLIGCGFFSGNKEEVPWNSSATKPWWFSYKGKERVDDMGRIKTHVFFDFAPYININERSLNFVPVTPVNSEIAYKIDVPSGKLYKSHFYCEQKDVWDKYSGSIKKPPYTTGVVPRMLDQVGRPQHIFVFGREDYYQQDHGFMSHRVRVIGGVVEEKCFSGNCIHTNNWEKRLILIAVDPYDSDLKKVASIEDLKDEVDWDEAKAFMQNSNGRNFYKGEEFPGYRIVGEIQSGFALRFALGRSHLFKKTELIQVRRACHKLYDYAWDYLVRYDSIKTQKYRMSLAELEASLGRTKALQRQVRELLKAKRLNEPARGNFAYRFRVFAEEYGKQFQTCTDFVQPNDINRDPERSWFFVFMTGFYKMQRMGHYYHCTRNAWYDNLLTSDGKLFKDPVKILRNCTESEINRAFDGIAQYLEKIRRKDAPIMRFIEYDNGSGGTHSKLFSWVKVDYKKQKCAESDRKLQTANKSFTVFPRDVRWSRVYSQQKSNRDFDVIY